MPNFKIKSFTQPGVFYNVRQYYSGEWTCTCPAWINRRKLHDPACDHIRRARHQRMRRHGVIHLRKIQMVARIKTYNYLVKRYVAKHSKLMATNIGRIATITLLYSQLQELQKIIIMIKKEL